MYHYIAIRIYVALYFILYHFQLSTEKTPEIFFQLKVQVVVLIHNLFHIYMMMGVFLSWTRTNAIIHLSSIILTSLSWKFNPIKSAKGRCPITLFTNYIGNMPLEKGYKDMFWLFNINSSKKTYYIYFTTLALLDLWVIFK